MGTGAVGAFYGSRLHRPPNGALVSVTCRSNYSAVKTHGLQLDTHSFGSYHFSPHAVFPSIDDAAKAGCDGQGKPFDFVVVATKALPGIVDDAELIAPLLDKDTTARTSVVLIQNGVGVEHVHRKRFPRNPILSAVTVVSAAQTRPGVIKQNRWTRISVGLFIGEMQDQELERRASDATARFVHLLQEGGIKDAEAQDEIGLQLVRWHKLAVSNSPARTRYRVAWAFTLNRHVLPLAQINSSMNPSSVLSGGTPNSRMSLDPELRRHLQGCMNEIFATAPQVLGRPWPPKLLKADAETILKSTERNAGGLPSMLLDWQAGRDMELEVILGNPVRAPTVPHTRYKLILFLPSRRFEQIRIARDKGIEMPRLQTLYALLKMAAARRKEDEGHQEQQQQQQKQSKL